METNNKVLWHTDSFWTSENVQEITKALVKFNAENLAIEKKGEANINATVKRRYVRLDDIMNAVRPVLAKYNCYVEQHLAGDSVITRVVHESGEFIASKLHYQTWEANQVNNLQRLGGGLTYLKRYAISAILNIVADEDTDAEGNDTISYKQPQDNREWLNLRDKSGKLTKMGENCIAYIEQGGSIAEIEKKYRINKETKQYLTSLSDKGKRVEDIYHETEE